MRPIVLLILLTTAVAVPIGCDNDSDNDSMVLNPQQHPKKVRKAAVAGLFYPRDEVKLRKAVDGYLAGAKPEPLENLRAFISPHAGFRYSGPTAAHAYKLVKGRNIRTVIVLAPSHYARFEGASIPDVEAYETPLGRIPLSLLAKKLVGTGPFQVNPECKVHRPDWWRRAPKELPPFGQDTPHTWEHSLEVQLPFLQRVLVEFALVPIVFGRVDPEAVARGLADRLDDRTLVVASSDLSHFHPYEVARDLDTKCIKAICSLDTDRVKQQKACGKGPILALLHIARMKGWKAKNLDYRNSGDTASRDRSSVVGYTAIGFFASGKPEEPAMKSSPDFTFEEQGLLLDLARKTIEEVVRRGEYPKVDPASLPKKFSEPRACFVTLTRNGRLRGCIGHIFARMPLYKAVLDNAMSAALRDTRFRPVEKHEVEGLKIEVSVLTRPVPLEFTSPEDLLRKLRPNVDGVVLQVGEYRSTYLPQVWEKIPSRKDFLDSLARKAGLSPEAWKNPDAEILVYQVKAFKESESEERGRRD